jgi:hypothetical protein
LSVFLKSGHLLNIEEPARLNEQCAIFFWGRQKRKVVKTCITVNVE